MAWINGQWVDDRPGFGGMLGGLKTKPPAADVMKSGIFKEARRIIGESPC